MDNTDKIKSEIIAILDSATDKELTKQWIVEALDEGLQLKPKCANSKSEALNPTVTFGPSFTEKCEVKVNPNSKPSVKSKIADVAFNQLLAQGVRELIDWITNYL